MNEKTGKWFIQLMLNGMNNFFNQIIGCILQESRMRFKDKYG